MKLSDEFRLVAACCIWPPSERRTAAIRQAAQVPINWAAVQHQTKRHRVAGLVRDGLERAKIDLPEDVRGWIACQAAVVARQSLRLAGEALYLQRSLDGAGLPVTFLKGTALGVLAYGKFSIKQAWDIDMLVLPEDLRQVRGLLMALGYERVMPPPSMAEERFQSWIAFANESWFYHRGRDINLELHWRLSGNRALLSRIDALSGVRSVAIGSQLSLRTLNDVDLFAYLCLHGAHHGWARLKWLADLAALLAQWSGDMIEQLYRRAKADGVGHAAAQGLLLCEELFGTVLPGNLGTELRSDRATRWLVWVARGAMAGDSVLGNFRVAASHFLLSRDLRGWLSELNSKIVGWTDFQIFALPRPLYFLYPLLRLPSWVWRKLNRQPGN
ncbi:MAG: nucleotidyltransferase family protein [Proteobacteria bacterium]|nr:nucleotidyltransferase family protein [Pseudomonadota bacterium]